MATGPWHQARRAEQFEPQAAFQLRQQGLQATTSHRECLRSPQGLPTRLHPIRQAGPKLPRLRLPRCCYRMVDLMSLDPRRLRARTIDALWRAIGDICSFFTEQECANYLKAAGYVAD